MMSVTKSNQVLRHFIHRLIAEKKRPGSLSHGTNAKRLVGFFLFALFWMVISGCNQAQKGQTAPPAVVTVAHPTTKEIMEYFEFPGQIAPVKEVDIRARVTGYLTKIHFVDGEEVDAGELLYEIDPRPYEAALQRAEGELARLKAISAKAKTDLTRAERLLPSGAVSQDEYESRSSALAGAEASVVSAEAAVQDARLNLEFTKIHAPVTGRMSRTRITEGNLIQTGTDAVNVLTTIVTVDPVYVYFNVDERALLRYASLAKRDNLTTKLTDPDRIKSLNIPVEIGLENEDGFPHKGVLDFIDNEVDTKTGTIRARGVFENKDRLLTSGLYVRVRVPIGKPRKNLLIDEKAVNSNQREKFLWVVDKDNIARYRTVKIGGLHDGMRVIESGIEPDDVIIVKGLQRVRANAPVVPHAEGQPPATAAEKTPTTPSPIPSPGGEKNEKKDR